MSAGARDRRQRDRDQRRAAANRRIGNDLAWFYYWETPIKVLASGALLAAAAWFLWTRVNHHTIAAWILGIGLALVVASSGMGVIQRKRARLGFSQPFHGFALVLAGFAGVLLFVAGSMMWQAS